MLIVAILKDLTPVPAFPDFRVMVETAQVNVYFQSCKYPEHGISCPSNLNVLAITLGGIRFMFRLSQKRDVLSVEDVRLELFVLCCTLNK